MKHLTLIKLTTVFFIILFLSCFFEATNPLDSGYQGSYNFVSTDTLPSQLEVLKEYKIYFKNNGTDKYWKFYCSFDSSGADSVVRRDSSEAYEDSGFVSFVFKQTYKGKIRLIAEQPNRTIAEMPLHTMGSDITVINPYTIEGPRLAGIGDSVFLRVLYKGKAVQTAGSDTVIINSSNLLSESYLVRSPESRTTVPCQIIIKRNNDTLNFPTFTISYPGYSPRISNFSISTPADSLKLGGPARFSVRLFNGGNYSGIHYYRIISGTSILSIDTLKYIDSTTTQMLTIDTLKDTLYSKLTLIVSNSDTLSDTFVHAGINVNPAFPDIKFRDSTTAVDQDSSFKVDVVVNDAFAKDSFYWSFRNVKDSLTVTPFIIIPPSRGTPDQISVYVKRVYALGEKNLEFKSDTITKVINPILFPYKIQLKSSELTQIIARKTETFEVSVTNGTLPVPDSLLTYTWSFPSADTNYVKIVPKAPKGSSFSVTVLDSARLLKFYFSVKARLKNGTDSTALLTRDITVRNYKPSLQLIPPVSNVTNLAHDIAFDVADSNGIVSAVYYKFSDSLVSDDKSVKSVPPQSKKFTLFFTRNGKATVKAWAVDTSGFVSDTQKVIFNVLVLTPQFPIKPDTVKATIGGAKMLHARLVSKLDSITYLWDRNGNRSFSDLTIDTTTFESDSISFTPQDSIPDTIFVQCVSKEKQQASNPYTIIIIPGKNAPVIDSLQVLNPTTAKYAKDSLQIKAMVSDPDSNLTSIKVTMSVNGSTDTLLNTDTIAKSPFKTSTILTTVKNTQSGTYKFTVTATDSRKNVSTSFITHSLLRGDPEVDSVRIKLPQSSYFVKKKVTLAITAKDPNRNGKIAFVQYIKSNDTSIIATRPWPDSIFTLNDTGSQYIRVRVIDDEGNRSPIASIPSPIIVLPHTPRIDGIRSTDTVGYLKKQVTFTIDATDAFDSSTNAESSSLTYFVSYNDTLRQIASKTFNLTFTTLGINRFFVKVADADSFYAIRTDSIKILDGKPVFVSGIDQKITYWTNDPYDFKFKCTDPNGSVDKVEINWGDGTPVTSTPVAINNSIFTFNKKYWNSNKKDSTYQITILLTDNDGNVTTGFDSVTIKQGKPTLQPAFGNDSTTIFGKYDPSSADLQCILSVHATDTPSGSILKYYWFLSRDSSNLESANLISTTPTYTVKNIPINVANTIYTYVTVLVMDDDSNIVKKKFNVYVDAPPQIPVLLDPVNGTKTFSLNSPVVLEWTGHDVHDSLNTKFTVFVRRPGSSEYKIIQNPVITVTMAGTVPHFKCSFTDTDLPGSYSWQVVATDQLGSVTTSEPTFNSSFVITTQ